jgi:hypothetical protein
MDFYAATRNAISEIMQRQWRNPRIHPLFWRRSPSRGVDLSQPARILLVLALTFVNFGSMFALQDSDAVIGLAV